MARNLLPIVGGVVVFAVGSALAAWLLPGEPSLSDCDGIADDVQKRTCRHDVLLNTAEEPGEILAAIEQADDAETRDMLRIRLVAKQPETSPEICPQMEGEQAKKWCADLEGRSHLWMTGEGIDESSDEPVNGEARGGEKRGGGRGRGGRKGRGRHEQQDAEQ